MKHEHKYFNEPGDDWTVEESSDGIMLVWVGNEYYVKVNFCPVCGEKAKFGRDDTSDVLFGKELKC